ncbi:MAG: hypothetical protein HWN68_19350, partial [Desulfobacterales bacterium]|nr:hypothetical protein [Desulfobacterales bacterium]
IMKKGIRLEQSKKAVAWCKRIGMEVRAYFMVNNIGETKQTIRETIDFAKSLDPDYVDFEIVHPYPGSELRCIVENHPRCHIVPKKWNDWNAQTGNEIVFWQDGLSVEDIAKGWETAVKEFYVRPKQFLRFAKKMNSFQNFKDIIRSGLNVVFARAR